MVSREEENKAKSLDDYLVAISDVVAVKRIGYLDLHNTVHYTAKTQWKEMLFACLNLFLARVAKALGVVFFFGSQKCDRKFPVTLFPNFPFSSDFQIFLIHPELLLIFF